MTNQIEPAVLRPDEGAEFETDERCRILEVSNSAIDPDLSVARARVEPGVTTRWHALDSIDERYLIVGGSGVVEVGEESPERVGPGDMVIIPRGVRQRIRNDGQDDLVFYCLCTPRFRPEDYRTLE